MPHNLAVVMCRSRPGDSAYRGATHAMNARHDARAKRREYRMPIIAASMPFIRN